MSPCLVCLVLKLLNIFKWCALNDKLDAVVFAEVLQGQSRNEPSSTEQGRIKPNASTFD